MRVVVPSPRRLSSAIAVPVLGQHRRPEGLHALLDRPGRERVEQPAGDAAPLPVVGDHDRRLRLAGRRAHVAGDPHARPRVGVDRDERLVVVVVDLREVVEIARAERRHRAEEPPVAGLGAQPLEAGRELLAILRLDRADQDLRAVAERRAERSPPAHLSAGTSISRLRILPVGPLGSSSVSQTTRGYL